MVDGARLCDTLRSIREQGDGAAQRCLDWQGGYEWRSGQIILDGQAISDLIILGWLRPADNSGAVRIDDFPVFAPEVTIH